MPVPAMPYCETQEGGEPGLHDVLDWMGGELSRLQSSATDLQDAIADHGTIDTKRVDLQRLDLITQIAGNLSDVATRLAARGRTPSCSEIDAAMDALTLGALRQRWQDRKSGTQSDPDTRSDGAVELF
ncbi:MAG: hypothetical protein AAF311_00810 [Pseudomonadota bacterium]